jgi:hypothetical protein
VVFRVVWRVRCGIFRTTLTEIARVIDGINEMTPDGYRLRVTG